MAKQDATKDKDERDRRLNRRPTKKDRISAFFDMTSGGYYAENDEGEFQKWPDSAFQCLLRSKGFTKSKKSEYDPLTFLEEEMLRITHEQSVHFAGPLGGFDAGLYDNCGCRVLVTRGPKFIEPVAGKFDHFGAFLHALLGDQKKYFLGWIKSALASLRNGLDWSPGQLLAVAGGVNSGKSLLQTLITPLLGGRLSSPYDYMTGKTAFNAEIFGAEHGLIGDQNHRTDYASRRAFGSAIKTLVVNREQFLHGKGKTGVTLMPFLRLTLTLNDNAESLLVLPPLDSDVSDKVMLLKAAAVKFPFPSKQFPTPQDYVAKLRDELPAFLFWLKGWKIPEAIRDARYGVKTFHHPDLEAHLYALSPELRLWELIETYLFVADFPGEWEGSSSDLQAELERRCQGRETRTIFPYSTACGQLLAKLADRFKRDAAAEGEEVKPAVESRNDGGHRKRFTIRKNQTIKATPTAF